MDLAKVTEGNTIEALDALEQSLMARAYLYEPPQTYREAVHEVLEMLRAMIARATAAA